VTAHIGGLPLEEIAPSIAGIGVALLLARAWVVARLRQGAGCNEESR
jgi:hypothetical protein